MKFKYLLPLLAPTIAVAIVPFCTSCGRGENETDILMDLYAKNSTGGAPTTKTETEYFHSWMALSDIEKLVAVEYSLYSFVLKPDYIVLPTSPGLDDIKLKNGESLFSLCSGDNPTLIPLFNTGSISKIQETAQTDVYKITYIGRLAFQFQKNYSFYGDTCTCIKGDILQFALNIPNAEFSGDLTHPDGLWIEQYNMNKIVGDSIGISELQSHGEPFAMSNIGHSDLVPHDNYFHYAWTP